MRNTNVLGCFKLDGNLPLVRKHFEGRNLDFTSRELVFFDVSPTTVTIFSYEVDSH